MNRILLSLLLVTACLLSAGLCGCGRAVISHCQNEEAAQQIKDRLLRDHPNLTVDVIPTRGLDSFYAERHGLIVGF